MTATQMNFFEGEVKINRNEERIKTIISASRRTDIPAFYSEWFMKRVEDGYFVNVNPYNKKQSRIVSLLPGDVELFVFWTKAPQSLMGHLGELDARGYRYYFQYTLNDYPKFFEPNLPPLEERVNTFIKLAGKIGSKKVIWRYDPIIVSSITPVEYHIERFEKLASRLRGHTDRVVISFLDFYDKVKPRLKKVEDEYGVRIEDIASNENRDELTKLTKALREIADESSMGMYSCSEPAELPGIPHGACIDVNYINSIFGLDLKTPKDKNQRPQCLCAQSVDMGMYNTCPHLCAYCYANFSKNMVYSNRARHNPESPVLVG